MKRFLSLAILCFLALGLGHLGAQQAGPWVPTTIGTAGASTMAVDDRLGLLALGMEDGRVILYRLSNTGEPGMAPLQTLTLPGGEKPAPEDVMRPVFSMAFHPKLPLLYVWQVYSPRQGGKPKDIAEAVHQGLPHLVIFHLGAESKEIGRYLYPKLTYAAPKGMLVLNQRLDRLYIPGAGEENPIRWLSLNAQGLPVAPEGPVEVETFGVDSGRFIHNGRMVNPGPDDTLLAGANHGIRFYDVANRVVGYQPIRGVERMEITVHPDGHRAYLSYPGGLGVMSVVDGRITGLTRHFPIPGKSSLGPVAVLSRRQQVALTSNTGVVLIGLDKEGWPTQIVESFPMVLPKRQHWNVLTYSPRFDRLYVPNDE